MHACTHLDRLAQPHLVSQQAAPPQAHPAAHPLALEAAGAGQGQGGQGSNIAAQRMPLPVSLAAASQAPNQPRTAPHSPSSPSQPASLVQPAPDGARQAGQPILHLLLSQLPPLLRLCKSAAAQQGSRREGRQCGGHALIQVRLLACLGGPSQLPMRKAGAAAGRAGMQEGGGPGVCQEDPTCPAPAGGCREWPPALGQPAQGGEGGQTVDRLSRRAGLLEPNSFRRFRSMPIPMLASDVRCACLRQ